MSAKHKPFYNCRRAFFTQSLGVSPKLIELVRVWSEWKCTRPRAASTYIPSSHVMSCHKQHKLVTLMWFCHLKINTMVLRMLAWKFYLIMKRIRKDLTCNFYIKYWISDGFALLILLWLLIDAPLQSQLDHCNIFGKWWRWRYCWTLDYTSWAYWNEIIRKPNQVIFHFQVCAWSLHFFLAKLSFLKTI